MSEEVRRARLRALVHGRVQGVGYRWYVIRRAREAGLVGWVRNRADGSVECMAEGPRSDLERLLTGLRAGPRPALVTEVEADWQPARGDLGDFDVTF